MSDPRASAGRRGRFIVLDGIDGCGKSTQAARLVARLARGASQAPLHVREPGSTPVGERIRELLLEPGLELSSATEALLFCAARAQMLASVVEPALARGLDVVCERFHPSTYAYQGVAGGLDPERVLALLHTWAGSPAPDLIVLLALDPAVAAARRGRAPDRIEAKGLEHQRRVAAGLALYAERAQATAGAVVVVDATGSADEVEERIHEEVRRVRGDRRL